MRIALDTETTGLEWWKCKAFGLSYCKSEDDFGYDLLKKYKKKDLKELLAAQEVIFHNAKFDIHFLRNAGYPIPETIHDTLVMAHLLNENKPKHLADVAKRYTGAASWKDGVQEYVKENNCTYDKVPYKVMKEYAANDALHTFNSFQAMEPLLKGQGLWDLYRTEMDLLKVVNDMERRGVLIDVQALKEAEPVLSSLQAGYEKEIYTLAKGEFNIMSPKQLGKVLFEDLGLEILEISKKSKQPKTDKDTLGRLDHPILDQIINYRIARKLRSTYCENIMELVDKDSILHCNLNQLGARTGRFSCSKPNLQNIPNIDDEDNKVDPALTVVRRGFICRPDYYNFYFDYKQMELMVYAHFANEESMKEAFAKGEDLHRALARKFYKKNDISDVERHTIKMLNFGILYGMGAKGLAARFKKSEREAKEILNGYYTTFPVMKRFRSHLTDKIRSHGYLQNPFGRRRRLTNHESYKGVNALVQGTCADIMKKAMIRIHKLCQSTKSNLLLSIHDEGQVEIHKSELDLVPEIIKVMEDFPQFSVPLKIDVSYTKTNWKDKGKYAPL